MGNKKKKQRLEAQKVKLKVGRRLVKSNMTSTVFKSGKIVLAEQIPHFRAIAPGGDEGSSSAAVSSNSSVGVLEELLKDATNKLSHCSSGARYKAVCWLRKTLNKRGDFIAEHLHEILQRVLLLLRDSDGVVREASRLFVGQLVCRLSDSQFEPHWPLLAKHLSCIFTSSSDMNLHSECVNLVRHVAASRPRAVIAHCTGLFQAFLERLASLQPAKLVPYLSVNVGDGSLAAIASNICKNKNAEPLLDRLLQLLTNCHEVGLALLSEKKRQSKSSKKEENQEEEQEDGSLGFRPKEFSADSVGEKAKPLYVFIYSPLSLRYRMQMQQFSSFISASEGSSGSNTVPITFREKVEEISRLMDVAKKLNK